MKTEAVVIAAGYGPLRREQGDTYPKLLEDLEGKPMVVRALDTVRAAGFPSCVLVVNPRHGELIRAAVRAHGHDEVRIVVQQERRGTADALACAIDALPRDTDSVLVSYWDMPLWKPQQVRDLVANHLPENTVTMVTMTMALWTPP